MRQVPPAHTPIPPAALARLAAPAGGAEAELRAVLAERWPGTEAVLVGSGTQALTLGLATLAGPEGEIALPGWGCYDLASAAVGAGVGVRLYDLDPRTLQPDPVSLARAADGAAVGVVVSFFGIPVEPARLPTDDDTLWIHDAAQAHGARFGRDSIDARADATVLSFGRGKGWTGLGGGALLLRTDRARAAVDVPALGEEVQGRLGMLVRGGAQWLLGRPSIYGLPARIPALGLGETHYHPPRRVHRMAEIAPAVLLATRAEADAEAEVRRREAAALRAALTQAAEGRVVDAIEVPAQAEPGYLRFPVLDRGTADRERGVALGVLPSYPRPLDTLEPLKPLLRTADPLPGCSRLARDLLTLPTHSRMSSRDRARLRAWSTASASVSQP